MKFNHLAPILKVASKDKFLLLEYQVINDKPQRYDNPNLQATLGLLQGWLDVVSMGILSLLCFCSGWTFISGLLVVNLYFYFFIGLRFRAGRSMNSSPAASPARWLQP